MSSKVQIGPWPNVFAVPELANVAVPLSLTWDNLKPWAREFLDLVVPKYPHYTFHVVNDWREYPSIRVYEGGLFVGAVSREGGTKTCLTNDRIRSVRTRGDRRIKSTNMKEVVKNFHRYFYSVSPGEVIAEDLEYMSQCMMQAHTLRGKLDREMDDIFRTTRDFVIENWESFAQLLVAGGVLHESRVQTVIDQRGEVATTGTLHKLHKKNVGYNVLIKGDYYYVRDRSAKMTDKHTFDTLPDAIKRCVGLLKMVPDSTFVNGVGVRRNETSFYVLGDMQ